MLSITSSPSLKQEDVSRYFVPLFRIGVANSQSTKMIKTSYRLGDTGIAVDYNRMLIHVTLRMHCKLA